MLMLPKISVITPTYNCGQYLERCLQSVLAQRYENIEHIVIDGGSKDNTIEVLRKHPHLRWISEPDRGEGDALNKGLRLVQGDVVCWLNADDWYLDNVFQTVGGAFSAHPDWQLVYGNTNMVGPDGKILWVKQSDPAVNHHKLVRWWLCNRMPHQPSMFFSQKLIKRVGPFKAELHFSIDLEYWVRCSTQCDFHHIDMPMSCALQRPDCKSQGTEPKQVQSHWCVIMPHLKALSEPEQADFWEDYYFGRLTGLEGNAVFEATRVPEDLPACEGLKRACAKLPTETDNVLVCLFPEVQIREQVKRRLRGAGEADAAVRSIQSAAGHAPASNGAAAVLPSAHTHPLIVIDGVFFDMYKSGIARVWEALLREFAMGDFAPHLLLLDRNQSAPAIAGIRRRPVPAYDARLWAVSRKEFEPIYPQLWAEDRAMLQRVCDEERADLFVSIYYTTVETTPSVAMIYDMIPEVFGFANDGHPQWIDKQRAIRQAAAYLCISENTRRDLHRFFPEIDPSCSAVTPCGVNLAGFQRVSPERLIDFHKRHNLAKPYFLLVGGCTNYKNAQLFFKAVSRLPSQHGFQVVVTGGSFSENDLGGLRTGCDIVCVKLSEEELLAAYSGAVALVYPSLYEGFGLPILEAMACGCPVICTPFSALPEVGGDAVLYAKDADELAAALCEIQKPAVQARLIQAGRERVKLFSWKESARKVRTALEQVCAAVAAGGARKKQEIQPG
jgi:glycosyltransferase involved in cell wall biosynthesis